MAIISPKARLKGAETVLDMPKETKGRPAGSLYRQIWEVVRMIPPGRVASYGQIAHFLGCCTPRMVGFAMAGVPYGSDVPWHRVVNSKGMISDRSGGDGARIQRVLLEAEGVCFDENGRLDLAEVGWEGRED